MSRGPLGNWLKILRGKHHQKRNKFHQEPLLDSSNFRWIVLAYLAYWVIVCGKLLPFVFSCGAKFSTVCSSCSNKRFDPPPGSKNSQKSYKIIDLDHYFGYASRVIQCKLISNFNSWYNVDPLKVDSFVQTVKFI